MFQERIENLAHNVKGLVEKAGNAISHCPRPTPLVCALGLTGITLAIAPSSTGAFQGYQPRLSAEVDCTINPYNLESQKRITLHVRDMVSPSGYWLRVMNQETGQIEDIGWFQASATNIDLTRQRNIGNIPIDEEALLFLAGKTRNNSDVRSIEDMDILAGISVDPRNVSCPLN